jgi:hypothetical protein
VPAQAPGPPPEQETEATAVAATAAVEVVETRTVLKGHVAKTLVRYEGELRGQSLELEQLVRCTVLLLDVSSQVTIHKCVDCVFVIGPVDGSVFLIDSQRCSLSAACRQLRTRGCVACDVFTHTLGPVIESSSRMRFERWNVAYPGQASQFAKAKLDAGVSNWASVYDFTAKETEAGAPGASGEGGAATGAGTVRAQGQEERADSEAHWARMPADAFSNLEIHFEGAGAARLGGGAPHNAAAALLTPEHAAAQPRVLRLDVPATSAYATAERVPIGKRLIDGKWMLVYEEEDMRAPNKGM